MKKLGLKERYSLLTRGLDWETSYQPMDEVFPYDKYEGIKSLTGMRGKILFV